MFDKSTYCDGIGETPLHAMATFLVVLGLAIAIAIVSVLGWCRLTVIRRCSDVR
jgi:hypothetical protein